MTLGIQHCNMKLILLLIIGLSSQLVFTQDNSEIIILQIGQSEILEYLVPVKRISISDPQIADATVTSPRQILINGKSIGNASLIVWDEKENYTKYKIMVQNEASPYKVRLQVRFVEVKQSALKEFGVNFLITNQEVGDDIFNFGSYAGKVTSPNIPLVLGETVDFFLGIPTQNFQAVIQVLEEKGILTTLAKPNISAVDGEKASFLAGGEFPVPIAQGGMGGQQTVTIQWKEFGVALDFVPRVLDSKHINIKLTTEVSSLDFDNGVTLSGFQVPALISRKSETTIELEDGEHFIIGGLISSEMAKAVSKTPFIGSIPIIGALFRSTHFLNNESELIVMVTPNIVKSFNEILSEN
jgi:pilus assembly protein CpaC